MPGLQGVCGSLTGVPPQVTLLDLCTLLSEAWPPRKRSYLQECLLLFKVLADHRGDVIRLGIGAQFVGSSTPVLFSLVLLLQALEDTADLWAGDSSSSEGPQHLRAWAGICGEHFQSGPRTKPLEPRLYLTQDCKCRPFRTRTKRKLSFLSPSDTFQAVYLSDRKRGVS